MDPQLFDIRALAQEVWETMVGLDVQVAEEAVVAGDHNVVVGVIRLAGSSWSGTVALHCTEELAQKATALMFDMELDELDDELITDAVGELTNMVGGGMKTRLELSADLSLPTVISGAKFKCSFPKQERLTREWFSIEGLPFVIDVNQDRA